MRLMTSPSKKSIVASAQEKKFRQDYWQRPAKKKANDFVWNTWNVRLLYSRFIYKDSPHTWSSTKYYLFYNFYVHQKTVLATQTQYQRTDTFESIRFYSSMEQPVNIWNTKFQKLELFWLQAVTHYFWIVIFDPEGVHNSLHKLLRVVGNMLRLTSWHRDT